MTGSKPRIMGILNVTPDSFFDGGRYSLVTKAHQHAKQMVAEGADIIDVGGESTRPGAKPVSVQEELDRVIPVIEMLTQALPVPVSIDTREPEVMQAAIAAGASWVNDTRALQKPGALEVVAKHKTVFVCLMHMQGQPDTMQETPFYRDVVSEVKSFLIERMVACQAAGIASHRLIVDPGFGFGKSLQHNLQLLRHLETFTTLEVPLLVGLSRKSMIHQLLGLTVDERLYPSIALAVLAVNKGANIVRVHDVRETAQAIAMVDAVKKEHFP